MHCSYETSIVSGFPRHVVLDDQSFPNRIERRSFGQSLKHAFEPRQFTCRGERREAKAVLFNRPRGHHPQLDEVLRNDVELRSLRGQDFNRGTNDFTLRMSRLQSAKQRAGIDKHGR